MLCRFLECQSCIWPLTATPLRDYLKPPWVELPGTDLPHNILEISRLCDICLCLYDQCGWWCSQVAERLCWRVLFRFISLLMSYLYLESRMWNLGLSFQKVQWQHLSHCVCLVWLPVFEVLTVVFVSVTVLNLNSIHGTADHQNPWHRYKPSNWGITVQPSNCQQHVPYCRGHSAWLCNALWRSPTRQTIVHATSCSLWPIIEGGRSVCALWTVVNMHVYQGNLRTPI